MSVRCAAAAVLLASLAGSRSYALTLSESLASAYRSNFKLLAQRAQLKIIDEDVAKAQANWRPTISVQAAYSYVHDHVTGADDNAAQTYLRSQYPGDSYGLTVTQPLYRGGRTVAQLRQAHAAVKEGEAELLQVEEEVLLSVVADYLDLARDQTLLELTAERELDTRRQLEGARSKLGGGEATRLDVATAEAALQDGTVAHQQAVSQEITTRLAFARDTGLAATQLSPVMPRIGLPETLARASDLATTSNFQVQQAEYAVRVAEAALVAAKGEGLPTVSLQGTWLHQDGVTVPGESEEVAAASVQLKIPLYSGGQLSSGIRAARLALEQKKDLLDETRQTAEAQAGAAFAQMEYTGKAEAGLRSKSEALTTSLAGVRRQQVAGERSLSDIIAAEEALFVVQIAAVQAHHDALLAQYSLADTVGQLTAGQLGLPVDLYDPERYAHRIAWAPGR